MRASRYAPALLLLAAVCCGSFLPASATELAVVRVEEDWELVVGTPDSNSTAPQVTCVFSPTGDINGLYAALELNHQSQPAFVPGGLQLQLWNGEVPVESRKFPQSGSMAQTGELVRWTQGLCLDQGVLTFEIVNGSSSSWGSFGGQGYLKASVSTNLSNLNSYDPNVSVQHSGVGYAANRVQLLVLKRVRVLYSDGQLVADDTARVVCEHN